MEKNKLTYGFTVVEEKWADCDSVSIRVVARENDDASPINPRLDAEHSIWDAPKPQHGLMLYGLRARFYLSDYGVNLRSFEFEDASYIDAAKARAMLKTFDRLSKAMEKAQYPSEIGDYIEVAAKALGCSFYARRVTANRGWKYSDNEYAWLSINHLKTELREKWRALADEFVHKHPEKAVA